MTQSFRRDTSKRKERRVAVVSDLILSARSLGETLLRKQLNEDSMWWLNRRIAEFREDGLTGFVKMDTKEKKLLMMEQRELSRVISGFRKAIEVDRRKLERP